MTLSSGNTGQPLETASAGQGLTCIPWMARPACLSGAGGPEKHRVLSVPPEAGA